MLIVMDGGFVWIHQGGVLYIYNKKTLEAQGMPFGLYEDGKIIPDGDLTWILTSFTGKPRIWVYNKMTKEIKDTGLKYSLLDVDKEWLWIDRWIHKEGRTHSEGWIFRYSKSKRTFEKMIRHYPFPLGANAILDTIGDGEYIWLAGTKITRYSKTKNEFCIMTNSTSLLNYCKIENAEDSHKYLDLKLVLACIIIPLCIALIWGYRRRQICVAKRQE